jgi:uncharacterized protein YdeI (YjbR/CyaY-like superfamily)
MHKSIYFENRKLWRNWLKINHSKEKVIWLIYYKKHTKKPSIPYNDAVEEALCYGWIDSTVRRIDEEKYMQQFTPRNFRSNWSISNVIRVEKLISQKKMTKKGLDLYLYAKKHNMLPDPNATPDRTVPQLPDYFRSALDRNREAKKGFNKLTDTRKRYYLLWILDAKKEETRNRRVHEAIKLLKSVEEIGMK